MTTPIVGAGLVSARPAPALLRPRIELLSVDLLEQNRTLVTQLKRLAGTLKLEFGWHYLLDLSWIITQLPAIRGQRIMDAGAGSGMLQWYLAEQGAEVFSVDRMSRETLPLRFRRRYHAQGLRPDDLLPAPRTLWQNLQASPQRSILKRIAIQGRELASWFATSPTMGLVWIYNQDLGQLADIADDSLDAVVSISALEHNTPEGLEKVVGEILRVLKPGGVLLATLTAGKQDFWHEASSGWCYGADSLRRAFRLPENAPDNYAYYDELLTSLRDCAELRDNLASFYFKSDQNGMPWGKWDPQYLPVGICKVKAGRTLQ